MKCHLWLHIGSVSYGINLPVIWFLQTPTMGSSMLWGISLTDCLWLFPRHGSRTGLEWPFLIIKISPDQLCCAYVRAQEWHRPNEWDVCHGTKSWGGSSGYWSSVALIPLSWLYPISRHSSSLWECETRLLVQNCIATIFWWYLAFSIYIIISSANNATFPFMIQIPFIPFSCMIARRFPAPCWIEVVRMDTLALFLVLEGDFLAFQCWI